MRFGFGPAAFAAMVFVWCIIAASFIDFDTQLLPDSITLPLLWLGLLVNAGGLFTDLRSAVIGAAAGYLALWSVYWLFKLATGKEGMGFGDFKLLAAIGAWCGWQMLPLAILLSSFIGAAVGIALMVFARHGRSVPIPFGPYLGAAGSSRCSGGPSSPASTSASSCEALHGRTHGRHRQRQERGRRAVRQARGRRCRLRRDRTRAHAARRRGDRADTQGLRREPDRRRRRARSRQDAQARLRRRRGEEKARGDPASAHPRRERAPLRTRR